MTTFPRSPRVRKGAIIAVDTFDPLASVVVFQYNPATLTRTLTAQMASEEGARSEAQRFKGPPQEDISVTIEIDATDQLEKGSGTALSMGIYPQLSTLETIIYPSSLDFITNSVLAAIGTIEVIPPEAPLALFVWGLKRVLPVRLNSLTIEEEAYDVNLNPIRAKVSLGMRVLTYNDFRTISLGSGLFLAHQITKEVMGTIGTFNNLGQLGDVF